MTCTPERIRLGFGEALGRDWEKVLYFLTGELELCLFSR